MKTIYINSELNNISDMRYEIWKNGDKYPSLNADNIKAVHNYVTGNSFYATDKSGDFVAKYFQEHRGDTSLSSVITKIILIDTTDSTSLKQLLGGNFYVNLAHRIIDSGIEELIAKGMPIGDKFKYIAAAPVSSKKSKSGYLNLFVFVSKYITRVNQYSYGRNDYSILDQVVKEYLPLYSDVTDKQLANLRKEYSYDEYCQIFSRIQEKLGDESVSRVMIDHFIWFSHKKPNAENTI